MIAIVPLCLFVFLTLVPFVAGLTAFFYMRRGGAHPVTEPSCAACRAPVSDASDLQCPRCGADLREVGLITPRSQRRITPWMAVLIWTAIVPLPTFVLLAASTMASPTQYTYRENSNYQPNQPGLVQSVTVDAAGSRIEWPWQTRTPTRPNTSATITVTHAQGAQTTLAVDHRDGTYRYAVPDGREKMGRGPVTAENVLQWWRDTGVIPPADAEQSRMDVEAAQLSNDVATAIQMSTARTVSPRPRLTTLHSRGGGSSSSGGPVLWIPLGVLLMCAAAWIGGCVVFARRCMR